MREQEGRIDVELIVSEMVALLNLTTEQLDANPDLGEKRVDAKDAHREARHILEYRRRMLGWLVASLVSAVVLLGDISAISKLEGRYQFESLTIGLVCASIIVLSLVRARANSRNLNVEKELFIGAAFRLGYLVNTPDASEVDGLVKSVASIPSTASRIRVARAESEKPKRDRLTLTDDGELEEVWGEEDDDDVGTLIAKQ